MPLRLKVDLHTHTKDDIAEQIAGKDSLITSKELIDLAVENNYDAISITLHGLPLREKSIFEYASKKGLILIPGVETFINRKHVLLINYSQKKFITTFDDLRKNKTNEMLVIAPHPYFVFGMCLGRDLIKNIDVFDAIEYSHYYYGYFNLNRKAIRVAQKYGLPIVGNSDVHTRFQFGSTYSYVYAEERSIPAIISAIKKHKVEYVTHAPTFKQFYNETKWIFGKIPYNIQKFTRKKVIKYHNLRKFR